MRIFPYILPHLGQPKLKQIILNRLVWLASSYGTNLSRSFLLNFLYTGFWCLYLNISLHLSTVLLLTSFFQPWLQAGYRHIDTAWEYGVQAEVVFLSFCLFCLPLSLRGRHQAVSSECRPCCIGSISWGLSMLNQQNLHDIDWCWVDMEHQLLFDILA